MLDCCFKGRCRRHIARAAQCADHLFVCVGGRDLCHRLAHRALDRQIAALLHRQREKLFLAAGSLELILQAERKRRPCLVRAVHGRHVGRPALEELLEKIFLCRFRIIAALAGAFAGHNVLAEGLDLNIVYSIAASCTDNILAACRLASGSGNDLILLKMTKSRNRHSPKFCTAVFAGDNLAARRSAASGGGHVFRFIFVRTGSRRAAYIAFNVIFGESLIAIPIHILRAAMDFHNAHVVKRECIDIYAFTEECDLGQILATAERIFSNRNDACGNRYGFKNSL